MIRGGWYCTYCDNPLADEPDKTCRDVGSKHRYAEKCKNDSIWQTYNRAYKAHYARYLKREMTVAEFEKWSRFASEIRDKALAGEIAFEQYYVDIRKKAEVVNCHLSYSLFYAAVWHKYIQKSAGKLFV